MRSAAALAGELLDVVRVQTARPDLGYAEPPELLAGGYFTENHAFRLAGAPPPWDGPLVVRLFPASAPPELARREATIQRVLTDQGYPAPRVVVFDDDARVLARRFLVMERLPGTAMLGGIKLGELARSGFGQFDRLVDATATMQAALHRLDAAPLVTALGDLPAGIERWFGELETAVGSSAPGFAGGLQWLLDHRPASPATPCICHGDLWGGNILAVDGAVTGVIDWSVSTVAEAALDVGFTTMSLCLAPIDAPRPIQAIAARLGGRMAKQYVAAYQRQSAADLANVRYYEALRCAGELASVADFRTAAPADRGPRPTWDGIADRMVRYFRDRTGVTLTVPPPLPGR